MFDIVQRTFSSLLFLAILPSLALDHAYYNVPSLKYGKPSYPSHFGNLGADQAYDAPQLKDFGFTQTPGNHYCHPTHPTFFSLVTNLQDDKKLYLSSKYQNKYEGIFTISGNILPTLWWNATDGEVRFRQ